MSFLKGIIANAQASANVAEPQSHQVHSTTVQGADQQGALSLGPSRNSVQPHSEVSLTNADRQSAARQSFNDSSMPSGISGKTQSAGEQITPGVSSPTLPEQTLSQLGRDESHGKTVTREIDLTVGSDAGGDDKSILNASAPTVDVSDIYGESAVFSVPNAEAYEHEIFRTDERDAHDLQVPKTNYQDEGAGKAERHDALLAATGVAAPHIMKTDGAIENEQRIPVRPEMPPTRPPAAKGDWNDAPYFGGTGKMPEAQSAIHTEHRDVPLNPSASLQSDEGRSVPDASSSPFQKPGRGASHPSRDVDTGEGEKIVPPAIPEDGRRAAGSEKHLVQADVLAPTAQPKQPLSPVLAVAEPVSGSASPAPQKLAPVPDSDGGKRDDAVKGQLRRDELRQHAAEPLQPKVAPRAQPGRQPDASPNSPTTAPASPQAAETRLSAPAKNLVVNPPARQMAPPQVNRPRPMPQSPEVRIGQVDVFIEAPKANTSVRQSVATRRTSSVSRHYLRRV